MLESPSPRLNADVENDPLLHGRAASPAAAWNRLLQDQREDKQNINSLREVTQVKADLQGRMLMAVFELAKDSFQNATSKQAWWFSKLAGPLQRLMHKPDAANLCDFARAFDLFHDWYPKLQDEVRIYRTTWNTSKKNALHSMKELLDKGVLTADNDDMKEFFEKWIQKKLEDEDLKMVERETPADHIFAREDKALDDVRQNLQTMHALLSGRDSTTIDSRFLHTLLPWYRIIWIIVLLDLLFVYEACSLGMLTQLVFQLNLAMSEDMSGASFGKVLLYSLIPLWVVAFALIGAEGGELLHDSMQYPPFKRARASLIITLSQLRDGKVLDGTLDKAPLLMIDEFMTNGLLLCLFLGVLVSLLWRMAFSEEVFLDVILNALNVAALVWTTVFVILFVFSRLYNNFFLVIRTDRSLREPSDGKGDAQPVGVAFRPARCNKVLREAISTYDVLPGETWKYFIPLQRFLQIYKYDDLAWNTKHVHEWRAGEKDTSYPEGYEKFAEKLKFQDPILRGDAAQQKWRFLWALGIWVLTVVICYSVQATDPSYDTKTLKKDNAKPIQLWVVLITANVGMMITLWLISDAAKNTIPLFADNKFFRSHLVVFVICMVLFSAVSGAYITPGTKCSPFMTHNSTDKGDGGVFYNDGADESLVTPYPVCSMKWGSPKAPVRILDLAAMSWYAYDNHKENFELVLNQTFKNVTKIHWDDPHKLPRIVAARLWGTDENAQGTIIVAVRGTSSKLEIMTDIGMFASVAVMQFLDKLAPVCGTLPVQVLGSLLAFARLPFLRSTQDKMIGRIEDVVNNIPEKYKKDAVVITGHSLGGSFAEVAGATLRKPAVGFSAPGQFYLMNSFGTTRQAIVRNVVTIMPSMDAVPQVASHIDMVQRILCKDINGEHRGALECHSVGNAACELWRVCGDVQKRNFHSHCLKNYSWQPVPLVHKDCIGQDFDPGEGVTCPIRPS